MKIVIADMATCTECSHSFCDQYSQDFSINPLNTYQNPLKARIK